jgi:protein-ribulosamine 3-kinase
LLPQDLSNSVSQEIKKRGISSGGIDSFSFSSGGCINSTGIFRCGDQSFFLKWNIESRFQEMFRLEFESLNILRENCNLTVPEPLFYGETDLHCYLVMEHIPSTGQSKEYWTKLGEGLALLHRNTAENFGWKENNYIGSLDQINSENIDWVEFFLQYRLDTALKMAIDTGIMEFRDRELFEKMTPVVRELLDSDEVPALIHGDLWGGNIMSDSRGEPCIIDPAIYYANREVEIAFTTLFGRFGDGFYRAYQNSFPLSPGFEKRFELYNLYPLLVHANLFGGGYVNSARQIMKKFS